MSSTPFRLDLLGAPRLWSPSGAPVGRAAHKKRIALLAVLAVARGRPVPRDRLVALLWPELGSEPARHNLSEALYVLRKELGDGVLGGAQGGDVALDLAVVSSDVAEFQDAMDAGDAEGAVAVYGGPLLDGFYIGDAPEYERWVDGERDRLARAFAAAAEGLAHAAEAQGSRVRAVELWRRLAAHDPFSSRIALRLVRALDGAGERPAALRAAEAHAALLRHELGAEPDPDLSAFVARLRAEFPRGTEPPPPLPRAPAVETPAVHVRTVETVDPAYLAEAADAAGPADLANGAYLVEAAEAADFAHSADAAAPSGTAVSAEVASGPSAGDGSAPPEAGSTPAPSAPPRPDAGTRWRRLVRRGWSRAAVAGGLLAAALWAMAPQAGGGVPREARPVAEHDPRRIAVLYFEDLSPGGELRYLATGFTERLIHELSQVAALQVVSRGGVRPYRDGTVPFDSMVADLRVGSVVEGTVQSAGDSVWVTVRLVDAGTGTRLESVEVGGVPGDLVRLERALAGEVSRVLRRRLGTEVRLRAVAAETESDRALGLVLRAEQARRDALDVLGRGSMDEPSARRMLLAADSLLARAEAADRRWARPTLARGWLDATRAATEHGAERARLLRSAVERAGAVAARGGALRPEALELRGNALYRLAMQVDTTQQLGRLDEAERDLRAAVAARPSLACAWSILSQLLRVRGRLAESDLAARRALAEDAYLDAAPEIRMRLFFSALSARDHSRARDECERGRRQFPADWHFMECALTLLRNDLSRPADPAAAWRLVAELDRADPPSAARAQGRVYSPVYRRMAAAAVSARAGDGDSARAVMARALREVGTDPEAGLSLTLDQAWVQLMLGDAAGACRLVRGVAERRPSLAPYLSRDPTFCGASSGP